MIPKSQTCATSKQPISKTYLRGTLFMKFPQISDYYPLHVHHKYQCKGKCMASVADNTPPIFFLQKLRQQESREKGA